MKKIFMFLALVLGVVSCQDNLEGLDVNINGEKGYINVSLAEETRADSAFGFDLSSLTTDTEHELRYILEIYPENTDKVYRDVRYSDNTSVSFPVSIVAGQKYTFAVWADIVAEDANRAADADADLYYETSNGLKSISIIDANWNAMDEKRDAFTGYATLETGNLSDLNDMTLVRPFAKLRVVTNDIESATEPKSAKVTYTQSVYTQFDATTGTASNAKNKVHTYKTFPYTDKEGEMTLFADYLLVTETFATKFDIDVFSDENCTTSIKQNSFDTEISLVRNKVTTIKGSILTDGNITNTPKPANNEIWYTNGSTTEATTSYETDVFGANIVSNTYDAEKACWVIKFDGDVTQIGEYAFMGCEGITSVAIPDSVTEIGAWAFSECSGLTNITIHDSVKTIGNYAFNKCTSLTSVTIPDSVTKIGYGAFEDCSSLTSVTIGNSITTISEAAFHGCKSLTSVTIPDSVTKIERLAFTGCSSLEKFNGKIASEDGRCLIIDGTLCSFAPAGLTEYTIPDGVVSIGGWAFLRCNSLISVTIPDSVTKIEYQALSYCDSLTSVTIGNRVKTIGEFAFTECPSLTSITIPDSVTEIKYGAFSNCSGLESVTIGNSVKTIENTAFHYCTSLTSVTIPNSVTKIEHSAFEYCESLTSVTIGNGVTTIGNNAFQYCFSLEEFNGKFASEDNKCLIIDGVLTTFARGCGETEYTIPDGVTKIGNEAFCASDDLISVTIPDSVTEIGNEAFSECSNLTSVTIGNGVGKIGYEAFDYCTSLTSVYCKPTTPPTASFRMFDKNDENRKIYVPVESVDAYKTADYWSEYKNYIVGYDFENGVVAQENDEIWYTNGSTTEATVPENRLAFDANIVSNTYDAEKGCWIIKFDKKLTILGEYAFYRCSGLTSIIIPNSVTTIGEYTFYRCSGLTSITIPNSVTTIGELAFMECSNLTSVIIGDSVTNIGFSAFGDCSSLTNVTIGNSVTTISEYAFENCSSLTSVTIPDDVTTIGRLAFSGCSSLEKFNGKIASEDGRCLIINNELNTFAPAGLTGYTIPDGVVSIGGWSFLGCNNLTSVTIPDSVITIEYQAFSDCASLASVTIGNSVTEIGDFAFTECSSLTSVNIPDSVITIGDCAFYDCISLENVTIGNSVKTIKSGAFWNCSNLTSIVIPDSVTTVGYEAFKSCDKLTSVTIGDSVTNIGFGAFKSCKNLTSVYCKATRPADVELDQNNKWNTFNSNATGRKIYVPAASVETYKSASYWSDYAADIVGYDFENGVVVTPKPANNEIWYTTSNGQAVELYSGEYIFGANVVSNTYVDGKGVITLDGNATKLQEAFETDEYLLTVTLPDSVKELNDAAFSGCPNLHTINFGNGIETAVISGTSRPIINCPALSKFEGSIASEDGRCVICNGELFYVVGLEGLTSYTLPEGITSMNAVLSSTTLTQLTLPNSLTSIYLNTRSIPALSSFAGACASDDGSCVIINGELLYFAPMALSSTTSYTVDSRVTKIASAFPTSNTLKAVTFPSGCTEVTTRLFGSCANIESVQGSIASTDGKCVVVNNTLIELVDKKLTSYTIPAGITEIGASAFEMGAITSITVPASVTKIGYNAFSNSNTSSIYFKSTTPAEISLLYNQWVIDENIVLYVPAESVAAYKASWSDHAADIVGYDFENGVVVTPKPANNEIWYTNGSTTVATTPYRPWGFYATIKSNSYDPTKECWVIEFEGNVTEIVGAFTNCSNLTSVTLPNSLTAIGYETFCNCSGIRSVNIPDGVLAIADVAFYGCSSLTSITIPDGINWIGARAFEDCISLTSVYCKDTTPPTAERTNGNWNTFNGNATGRKIYVPAESVAAYKSADGWKDYAADIVGYDFEKGEIVE